MNPHGPACPIHEMVGIRQTVQIVVCILIIRIACAMVKCLPIEVILIIHIRMAELDHGFAITNIDL